MGNIFEQWNTKIDVKGLQEDIKKAAENGSIEFQEIPPGTYEVAVEKMELKASKKGEPMLSIWFNIVGNKFKGQKIFYNQMLTTGFGIHIANEMLRSLDSGINITFEDYVQYNELIQDVFEEINDRLEYALEYGKNDKGFNTYKITEVFED